MHTGTQSHTQHIKWHHIANSASDAEGRHVLSCCLPVCPSIKQSLVPDSNWADNTVCLIPMVTRSLPHQDASWLWMWGDWDVHRLLAPIISPSEPAAVISVRVLIWSVSDAQVHICDGFRRCQAQAMLVSTLPFFLYLNPHSSKTREHTGGVFLDGVGFRGTLCFQDIDASFAFSNHPFEQRPSLPFVLPPALNKAGCP